MRNLTQEHVQRMIDKVWSISDYLTYLNQDCTNNTPTNFTLALTTDLSHWSECGVTTARDLCDYLDNEAQCNIDDRY